MVYLQTKIPNGGSCNGSCWYILWPFGKFSEHLVYFVAIWDIFWSFGILFPILVCCTKKTLATLFEFFVANKESTVAKCRVLWVRARGTRRMMFVPFYIFKVSQELLNFHLFSHNI
jgi:hypothetical protein